MPDIPGLVAEHLAAAGASPRGRSALKLIHDGPLRQSIISLAAGQKLEEHNTPRAATLQVLHGLVRVTSPGGDVVLAAGALEPLPHERHGLAAIEDSVVLLTAVTAGE
ncbi:cupin [Georgenia yuyongxinii]|uniref:Cupin n=1 Tax=Georgenia yuyongxinii TaxID=2589797 RepID=A0A552WXE9_9MICO|nr:cupin [Georgenia yuyongxinii]TRW46993.1 cupin [Georgenia yuyongxinii]